MGKMKIHRTPVRIAATWSLSLLLSLSASAASRTVYFNASGMNRTTEGLSSTASSTCKLTITNPSSVSQTISFSTTATSINFWTSASTSVTAPTGPTWVAGQTSCDTSCTLAASGGYTTYSWTYTAYPAKSGTTPTVTASKQQLRCSGSITVSDVTTPGFVIANGTLITFVESARMQTDATTGGTSTFGGIAVYTQVPITVNRGKPF